MPPEADQSSHGRVILPEPTRSPWYTLIRRLLMATVQACLSLLASARC